MLQVNITKVTRFKNPCSYVIRDKNIFKHKEKNKKSVNFIINVLIRCQCRIVADGLLTNVPTYIHLKNN